MGLARRYGLWGLLRVHAVVSEHVARLAAVYPIQRGVRAGGRPDAAAARAFASPEALLDAVGLLSTTRTFLPAYLRAAEPAFPSSLLPALPGPAHPLLTELLAAFTQANYNQRPAGMSALAGLVGLAPAATGSVETVRGGNVLVVQGLLRAAGARVRLGARVTRVGRQRDTGAGGASSSYRVAYTDAEGRARSETYEYVIVAAPLADSGPATEQAGEGGDRGDEEGSKGLELGPGVDAGAVPARLWARGAMQRTVSTLVSGAPNAAYLAVPTDDEREAGAAQAEAEEVPDALLTADRCPACAEQRHWDSFSSFAVIERPHRPPSAPARSPPSGEWRMKTHSAAPLSAEALARLFARVGAPPVVASYLACE